jgi:hypothetical protein
MAQLVAQAKRTGLSPEHYARRLVEDALTLQREAEQKSFAEILGPVRRAAGRITDAQIVSLVEKVRAKRNGRNGRGKKG